MQSRDKKLINRSSPSKRAAKKKEWPKLKPTNTFRAGVSKRITLTDLERKIQAMESVEVQKPLLDRTTMRKKRKLTVHEILYIADVIPIVPSAIKEIGLLMQQQHKNIIISQLLNIEIYPLSINILRAEIEYNFYQSLIEPGRSIGITCAEAIGGPLTQLTLSSFHMTGSAVAGTSGVDSMREMFNASQHRKKEFSVFHFKDQDLTFEEVYERKKHFDCITLYDLIKNATVIQKHMKPEEWWYNLYDKLYKNRMTITSSTNVFLRLHLNVQKLYDNQITTEMVANRLNLIEGEKHDVCKCIFSPTSIGIVDVYATESVSSFLKEKFENTKIKSEVLTVFNDENVHIIFLRKCIINKMNEIIIQGIEGLTCYSPVTTKLIFFFQNSIPFYTPDGNGIGILFTEKEKKHLFKKKPIKDDENYMYNTWKLIIDDISVRVSGVPMEKIIRLITETGLHVLYYPGKSEFKSFDPLYSQFKFNSIIIYSPPHIRELKQMIYHDNGTVEESKGPFDPIKYIKHCIETATYQKQKNIEDADLKILKYANYVHVETVGINMRALLSHPLVNPNKCKCNNFHVMNEYFDIEVMRNMFIREFYEHITNNAANINSRYLILIADFVTNQGFPIPLTSRGVARQKVGTCAEASFENAMSTFIRAAWSSRKEDIKSASAAIFLGVRGITGTGMIYPIPDEKMLADNLAFFESNEEFKVLNESEETLDNTVDDYECINSSVQYYGQPERSEDINPDLGVMETRLGVLCPKTNIPKLKKFKLSTKRPDWICTLLAITATPTTSKNTTPTPTTSKNTTPTTSKNTTPKPAKKSDNATEDSKKGPATGRLKSNPGKTGDSIVEDPGTEAVAALGKTSDKSTVDSKIGGKTKIVIIKKPKG